MTYREALKQGIRQVLQHDQRAFLMGEDVGRYGGAFAVSKGLLAEFGAERIMDVPLSESGFMGAGIGAAIGGMRPIVEIMTVNFSLLAMDQIVNNAATLLHMSGGQVNVPVIVRMGSGIGRQLAAQHSHSWEPLYAHIPGLKVFSIGTHEDARNFLPAIFDHPDPVIIFEYTSMLNMEAELPTEPENVNTHLAAIRKTGKDISLVTYGTGVYKSLEAANTLLADGIDVEVIDLRVLRPIDYTTVFNSIRKTHRAVLVEDAWGSVNISSEISARIMENIFYELDAPVRRLGGVEVPIPYPKHLEDASVPQPADIINLVKNSMRHGGV
ncbi:pyruvate dehydrogenase complex E1 component subunit beta [Flavihumibacter rivuli]|uniref:alpha-ketoacid dehydrogenase subunit beta n=1 Tax=Flavihumibacter rivuli TaxID=2838156 RepID=UPI001EFB2E45|nr:pyruvate dehydrogenase complex E1 component subunit beta [Flavihumibacter rivuli]ULQ57608.1 pyruvate dehydrogenase complex E1 component subunit beta [Flavihumibacter rivuli]